MAKKGHIKINRILTEMAEKVLIIIKKVERPSFDEEIRGERGFCCRLFCRIFIRRQLSQAF